MKRKLIPIVAILSLISLAGCNDSSDYDFDASVEDAQDVYEEENDIQPKPLFNPAEGIIPSATDLLFLGSTDGTLNIPIDPLESAGAQALKATLNELDGFSTISPITVEFNNTLKLSSVVAGETVRLFAVTTTQEGAVSSVIREVTAYEYVTVLAGDNQEILVIQPLVPLQEQSSYLVVFTNGITDEADVQAKADTVYRLLKSTEPFTDELLELEPLRLLTQTFEAAADSQGIGTDEIILSWVFSTQSVTPVLDYLAENVAAGAISLEETAVMPTPGGSADVYRGTLEVPYYLTAPSLDDPTAALTEYWTDEDGDALTRYNVIPAATGTTGTQIIPVLMTLPNQSEQPDDGWPVVIFQHGMTQDRTNLLAIADSLADAGYAAIAIDLPLHGVTDETSILHADLTDFSADDVERTFDMDLVDNDTGAAGPDGLIDSSGRHFVNLSSLLTSRDNLRQAISDLLVLRESLPGISNFELDTQQVYFIGHSLGGIAGTGFLAMDDSIVAATLAMPGGGIARLLEGSATFGDDIVDGLAANGVIQGTAEYDAFMVVAQTALDSADPINLAELAVALHQIHLMEVIGIDSSSSDQVIPNEVVGAPLSGTEPLARVMGLETVTATTDDATFSGDGIVRFIEGAHSSVLDPTSSLAATQEMQGEIVSFLLSSGSRIEVSNPDVVSQE